MGRMQNIQRWRKFVCANSDGVTDEQAAFTVIGAISLQSVRLINPEIGETIVVIGLGSWDY